MLISPPDPAPTPCPAAHDLLRRQREGRLSYASGRGQRTVVVAYTVVDGHIVMRLPDYNEIIRYAAGQVVTFEVDGDEITPEPARVVGVADLGGGHEPQLELDPGAERWPDGVSTSVVCLPYTDGHRHDPGQRARRTHRLGTPTPTTARAPDPRRLDAQAFTRAIDNRAVEQQVAAYAEDAVLTVIDPDNPPSAPHVFIGRAAIAGWLRAGCANTLTQRTAWVVEGTDRLAYTVEQRSRDGTHEVATSTLVVRDGSITEQQTVLVWDRWD